MNILLKIFDIFENFTKPVKFFLFLKEYLRYFFENLIKDLKYFEKLQTKNLWNFLNIYDIFRNYSKKLRYFGQICAILGKYMIFWILLKNLKKFEIFLKIL